MKAETLEELTTTTIASIVASIIGIPLAIITVKVIKDYSEVEHLLYELKDEEEEVKIIPDTDLQPLEN
jgi:ABC-type proline/glycine betaine transport system permease subunit